MRLPMTDEMLALFEETQPYYDESLQLRDDVPEEIKQKVKKLHELSDKQWREAMGIELGFDVDWTPEKP